MKYLSTLKLINKSIQTTANEKKAILAVNIPKPKRFGFVFVNRIKSFPSYVASHLRHPDEIGLVYVELHSPE